MKALGHFSTSCRNLLEITLSRVSQAEEDQARRPCRPQAGEPAPGSLSSGDSGSLLLSSGLCSRKLAWESVPHPRPSQGWHLEPGALTNMPPSRTACFVERPPLFTAFWQVAPHLNLGGLRSKLESSGHHSIHPAWAAEAGPPSYLGHLSRHSLPPSTYFRWLQETLSWQNRQQAGRIDEIKPHVQDL